MEGDIDSIASTDVKRKNAFMEQNVPEDWQQPDESILNEIEVKKAEIIRDFPLLGLAGVSNGEEQDSRAFEPASN